MQQSESSSVLSPKHIFKFVVNGIDELFNRSNQSLITNQTLSTSQFFNYLQSIQKQYKQYVIQAQKKNKQPVKHQQSTQNVQIVSLPTIPQQFYDPLMNLKLYPPHQFQSIQNQLTQYLDQVQTHIFHKIKKYNTKTFDVISNIKESESKSINVLQQIKFFRKNSSGKINDINNGRKKLILLTNKSLQLEQKIKKLQFCRKIKGLKQISMAKIDKVNKQHYQFMQNFKLQHIQQSKQINCLKNICCSVQSYRQLIKTKIGQQFQQQISSILKIILSYNQQWMNTQIPNTLISAPLNQRTINQSVMNITVLDQSLLECHEQTEQIDLKKLLNLKQIIDIYGIWSDVQVQVILKDKLVQHSIKFNKDIDDYINQIITEKNIKIEKNKNKIEYIEMKLYYKLVKVYFNTLKNLISFINIHLHQLPFLKSKINCIYSFIEEKVQYFLKNKPINQYTNKENIHFYINIIDYWINEQLLYQRLKLIKANVIDQYLLALQTRIQVRQLRSAIQRSTFTSIIIPSQFFNAFQLVLSWSRQPKQKFVETLEISMSIYGGFNFQQHLSSNFKVIGKTLIIEGCQYRISQTFLYLLKYIEHYLHLYSMFEQAKNNIQQKICQMLGFYVWYNYKILIDSQKDSKAKKTLKNICVLLNISELVRYILLQFQLTSKKVTKTLSQIQQYIQQTKKEITMVPFLMIQQQIEILYQSKIKQRKQIPTPETIRVLQIFKSATQILNQYFNTKKTNLFLTPSLKMISKSYFAYLLNMDQRGKDQLKYFLTKFNEIASQMFQDQINLMQKQLYKR